MESVLEPEKTLKREVADVESKETGAVSVLKGHLCDVADPGQQAKMQQLVMHLKECAPGEPTCPEGSAVTEKDCFPKKLKNYVCRACPQKMPQLENTSSRAFRPSVLAALEMRNFTKMRNFICPSFSPRTIARRPHTMALLPPPP